MAKAKEISGLDCKDDAAKGAKQVLQARFDEAIDLNEAALDFSDIEGIHDMRVALRRLRSALRDFKLLLDKDALKHIKKDSKQLAQTLGTVRDWDVFIAKLEELQAEVETGIETESIAKGIEKFLREIHGLREIARIDLVESLAEENIKELQKKFAESLDEAVSQSKKDDESFSEFARKAIAANLKELLNLSKSIYEPFNQTALHELRLAAKRLRYSIKLFAVCLGDESKPLAKEIGKLQDFLGKVHDCDVWIEILGKRLQENTILNESDRQTAIWLISELNNRRNKQYRFAIELWNEWETKDFIGKLKDLIS